MIYFDNAASGGFKPDSVYQATTSVLKNLLTNASRSGHSLSVLAENLVFDTRKKLSKHLNNGHIDRLIFTPSCTLALNYAILGSLNFGDEVIITVTEHNSVLRPLYHLEKTKNVRIKYAQLNKQGFVDSSKIFELITNKTKAIIMNAVSNVTGLENQFEQVGEKLKTENLKRKIKFIVDGAQAGGHKRFDMISCGIDALCLAGHKGLYAYQGVGVLALSDQLDIKPILFGGTGSETFDKYTLTMPDCFEVGTQNLPAIASLCYGIDYAYKNLEYTKNRLLHLTEKLIIALSQIKNIKLYSKPNNYGIVSFAINGMESTQVAEILNKEYQIAVRGGFHCAPLIHKALKTADNGLIRASLSNYNTENEIKIFIDAITKISLNLL